jgi:hypothetical protein
MGRNYAILVCPLEAFELTLEIAPVANELAPSRSRMRVDLRVDSEF